MISIFNFFQIALNAVNFLINWDLYALWQFSKMCQMFSFPTKTAVHLAQSKASFSILSFRLCGIGAWLHERRGKWTGILWVLHFLSRSLLIYSSRFKTELITMILAINKVLGLDALNIYSIFSDLKSATLAFKNRSTRNLLVSVFLRLLCLLHSRWMYVSLCWILSHVGIQGNEEADIAAFQATNSIKTCMYICIHAIDYHSHFCQR